MRSALDSSAQLGVTFVLALSEQNLRVDTTPIYTITSLVSAIGGLFSVIMAVLGVVLAVWEGLVGALSQKVKRTFAHRINLLNHYDVAIGVRELRRNDSARSGLSVVPMIGVGSARYRGSAALGVPLMHEAQDDGGKQSSQSQSQSQLPPQALADDESF